MQDALTSLLTHLRRSFLRRSDMSTRLAHLCILWLCSLACTVFGQEEPRLYSGEIEFPSIGPLGMTLGVSESEDGSFLLLTIPMQGVDSAPLTATYTADGSMTASIERAGLVFTVRENSEYTELVGKMEQYGLTFQIEFDRVSESLQLTRPQNPIEPYPYLSREISALHPDGHVLAGTLTIPNGEGPFACAVLISGSGQQDRNETLMGHQPFLIISDYLTRKGIAVLRFDDRGVGGSVMENPDELQHATSEDFASDAIIMVRAARLHSDIDPRLIGVIGHSEGGLIGPMVAVEDGQLGFVVMLAGPGVPGYELLPLQQAMFLKATDVDQELIDNTVDATMALYEMMMGGATEEELREQVLHVARFQFEATGLSMSEEDFAQIIDDAYEATQLPWLQFFLFHDPVPVLAKLKCPVLAMNGTLDVQVSSKQNLPPIERAIRDAGGDITIIELEGLNHLFQPAVTGAVSEYVTIETTFDPKALAIISDWILEKIEDE